VQGVFAWKIVVFVSSVSCTRYKVLFAPLEARETTVDSTDQDNQTFVDRRALRI